MTYSFQVLSASVDEITVQFINPQNKPIIVTANVLVSYAFCFRTLHKVDYCENCTYVLKNVK